MESDASQFNLDCFMAQGSSHKVNSDYALVGPDYGILCDGCTSSPYADVGARILAHCASHTIHREMDVMDQIHCIIARAEIVSNNLTLPTQSLFATLLTLTEYNDQFRARVSGDGVIVAKQSNSLKIISYEYGSNAPFYMAYLIGDGEEDYRKKFPDLVTRRVVEMKQVAGYGLWTMIESQELPIQYVYEETFSINEFDYVGIMSDGASSFVQTVNTGTTTLTQKVLLATIVQDLFAFKNFRGEFVQRRVKKAFSAFSKKSIKNLDDFSIVVMSK